jgi:4-amino-4-deoxy-L-arabinose transferase-like glycosyltransferase
MGLAVLTKGPVGFLVPLLGFVAFLAWERRLRSLRGFFPPWALLLSLGPGLAWIAAAVALAPAGFAGEAVGTNLFGRFFAGTSHARPFYYYFYELPLEFLPWTLLAPLVWWAGRLRVFVESGDPERKRAWRLLLAWFGAAFVFFSLSSGKRGLYLFPTFPALALLCADALAERLRGATALPRWIPALFLGLGALALAAVLVLVARPELAGEVRLPWALPVALAATIGGAAALGLGLARAGAAPVARFGALVAGVLGAELAVFLLLLPALEPTKSPRPIAEAAAATTPPGARVGLVGSEAKLGGLAYYSGRDVEYLDTASDIRRFLAAGGATLVVQSRKLDRIEAVTPVEITAELREGRRAWVVVVPRRDVAAPPR